MKVVLFIASVIGIVIVISFLWMAQKSKSGAPPGLVESRLKRCDSTPNCVCSEYPDDTKHYYSPFKVNQTNHDLLFNQITMVIEKMGGKVVTRQEGYIAATFSSSVFGFVDDLEIRLDASESVIHIRSASRAGYSDRGVNRKRVDQFVSILAQSSP